MKKEYFIEAVFNSTSGMKKAMPRKDLLSDIETAVRLNKTIVVSFVSLPKITAVAAAFAGLLIINIWVLSGKNKQIKNNDEVKQLIEQYGLINDDKIFLQ